MEKKQRAGWVLYDFANSTYHLLMPTILMPLFFRQYLANVGGSADLQWSIVVSASVFAAGLFAPFLGAFADEKKCRLAALVISAICAVLFAALVPLSDAGSVFWGGFTFGVSYFFFTLSLGIYDAFLPLVAKRKQRGSLSGFAWGIGYLGGILALGIVYPILGNAELPSQVNAFRISIWVTCLVYAVFCVPSFIMLKTKNDEDPSREKLYAAYGSSGKRVLKTIIEWRKNKELFKALVSYYLANDGLATLVYFTSIYAAATLGFGSKQILFLFLIVQVVGVPASIVGGLLADRLGHKKVLFSVLFIWVFLCAGFALCESAPQFYMLSIGTGLVIGTTPAVYRSLISEFMPAENVAELYGFNSFASRASSVVGPLLFGAIATLTGNQRPAMLSLLAFFILAGLILKTVNCSPILIEKNFKD